MSCVLVVKDEKHHITTFAHKITEELKGKFDDNNVQISSLYDHDEDTEWKCRFAIFLVASDTKSVKFHVSAWLSNLGITLNDTTRYIVVREKEVGNQELSDNELESTSYNLIPMNDIKAVFKWCPEVLKLLYPCSRTNIRVTLKRVGTQDRKIQSLYNDIKDVLAKSAEIQDINNESKLSNEYVVFLIGDYAKFLRKYKTKLRQYKVNGSTVVLFLLREEFLTEQVKAVSTHQFTLPYVFHGASFLLRDLKIIRRKQKRPIRKQKSSICNAQASEIDNNKIEISWNLDSVENKPTNKLNILGMLNRSRLWQEVASGLDPSIMKFEISSGMRSFKIICEIDGELCQPVKVRYRRQKCHCILMNYSNKVKKRDCIRLFLKIALSFLCFIFVFDMLIFTSCIMFPILSILALTKVFDPAPARFSNINWSIFMLTTFIRIVILMLLMIWMQNPLYGYLFTPVIVITGLINVVSLYSNESGLEGSERGPSCSLQFFKYCIPLNIFRKIWESKYF